MPIPMEIPDCCPGDSRHMEKTVLQYSTVYPVCKRWDVGGPTRSKKAADDVILALRRKDWSS